MVHDNVLPYHSITYASTKTLGHRFFNTPAELQRAFDSAAAAQRSWRDVPVTVRPGDVARRAVVTPARGCEWPKRRAASCGQACAAVLTRRTSLHPRRLARA